MSIPTHTEILTRLISLGETKVNIPFSKFILLGILAGAFIAMGGLISVIVGYGVPGISWENPAIQKLLSGLTFPIGLFMIVMLGGELFTGNNAVLIPGLIHRRITPAQILCNWIAVWLLNFIGALLVAYFMCFSCGLTTASPYNEAIVKIATAKATLPFTTAFLRGIGANWFVCMAVFIALMADSVPSKFIACLIPVGAFVMLGYEHSIANMFFIPAGMLEGADISLGMLFANLLPVTLGNIVGGALLVGMVYAYLYSPEKTPR